MSNSVNLLDELVRQGLKQSSPERVDHSLSNQGVGGQGGFLDDLLKQMNAPSGEVPELFPPMPEGAAQQKQPPARERAPQQQQPPARHGGFLEDVLGSLLGKSKSKSESAQPQKPAELPKAAPQTAPQKSSGMGWVGGGALALVGALALRSLMKAKNRPVASLKTDVETQLSAGLRPPGNDQEKSQVESVANLIVRAMINAAKADGQVDQAELERIMGSLNQSSSRDREFILDELQKPMETDAIVSAVPNEQVAAQMYAASLMAIDVDTEAEREYLADLAKKLKVDPGVAREIGSAVGHSF
jgi:uncharacterized membrane protein YebE (DUF533 family)